MQLKILSNQAGIVRASVTGKINQSHVSPFVEPLGDALGADAYQQRVLLDMKAVELLDSSGVSWLLSCHKRFREGGGRLVLCSLSDIAMNVVKVLNLQAVFKLAADEQEALQLLQGDAP